MKLILSIFFFLTFATLNAQDSECSCSDSIDFMLLELDNSSPSYKLLDDKSGFKKRADSIKNIAIIDKNKFNCLQYLNMILRPIQDGHLGVFSKGKVDFKDEKAVNQFLKSKKFNSVKIIKLDIDNLNKKDFYYSYVDKIKILIQEYKPNNFRGIVIDSTSKYWRKGELVLDFKKINGSFEGVRYSITKDPFFYKTKTLKRLLKKFKVSQFKREELNIFNKIEEKLSIKIIDDKILYVSIKSFKNVTTEDHEGFRHFFSQIVFPNYKKYDNIIFDVRDNSGGAMAYGSFLRDLRKSKLNKHILILQNRNTASAAELFILHLKAIKPITTFGENTAGMTAFRHIKAVNFPCYNYLLWQPIKKIDRRYKDYLKYEYEGLKADIELSETEDWMKRVLNKINNW